MESFSRWLTVPSSQLMPIVIYCFVNMCTPIVLAFLFAPTGNKQKISLESLHPDKELDQVFLSSLPTLIPVQTPV